MRPTRLINIRKSQLNVYQKRILMLAGLMLGMGLLVIYSSTIVHSQIIYKDPYRFVLLQLGWIVIGGIAFWLLYIADIRKNLKNSYLLFMVSLFFLGILAFSGVLPCASSAAFTPCINEANRWFIINPLPLPQLPVIGELGFQPSELAKLALIMYLSVKLPLLIKKGYEAFRVYFISTSVISGLVLLQPNMSTAVMLFLIGTIVYVASGASLKPLFIAVPALLLLGVLFAFSSPYRRERLAIFLSNSNQDTELSSGYHVKQVSIALGSGGLFGVGFGQSKQKYYIPEVSSDSIFSIIGEEFGLVGSIFVLVLFLLFVIQGLTLAGKLTDDSDRLLVIGVTSWIGLQFFIHVAANTSLIPYTGVPIPLISYGGSSMVFTLMGMGVMVGAGKRVS